MENKTCSRCNNIKTISEFGTKKANKDGKQFHCKECEKIRSRVKYLKNREKIIAREKIKYLKNIDKKKEYDKKYYKANKRKRIEQHKEWVSENRERVRVLNNSRKRRIKKAELEGYREEIIEIYEKCPKGYRVDHIAPINHPNLCGLHVPWNLQYLTAEENLKKGNKYGK